MTRASFIVLALVVGGCFDPDPLPPADADETTGGAPPAAGSSTTSAASGDESGSTSGGLPVDEATEEAGETGETGETGEATSAPVDPSTSGETGSSSSSGGDASTTTGGDQTRRVFFTEELLATWMVANGDGICQALAEEAGLDGEWVSWTSTADIDARDKLDPSAGPFVLLDLEATVIADDVPDLLDGSLHAPIDVDQWSQPYEEVTAVWTGTRSDGTKANDACLDWTSTESGDTGLRGNVTISGGGWTQIASVACSGVARIYCFEV